MGSQGPQFPGVDISSPFAQYLQATAPPQQAPAQPGRGIAGAIDAFLQGAQRGTYKRQQQELMKERQEENTLNQYLQLLETKDPEQANQVRQQIILARGQKAMGVLDKSTKGKDANPFLGALKNLGQGMMGGKVEKFKGYDEHMGQWAQAILNMPSKEQGYTQAQGQLNQAIQQVISSKNGQPVYLEDLVNNPQIRQQAQKIRAYYGVDPMPELEKTYGRNPEASLTPAQREIEGTTAAKARYEKALLDQMGQTGGGSAPPPSMPLARLAGEERLGYATREQVSIDGKENVEVYHAANGGTYRVDNGARVTGKIGRPIAEKAESYTGGHVVIGKDGKRHLAALDTSTGTYKIDYSSVAPAPDRTDAQEFRRWTMAQQQSRQTEDRYHQSLKDEHDRFDKRLDAATKALNAANAKAFSDSSTKDPNSDPGLKKRLADNTAEYNRQTQEAMKLFDDAGKNAEITYGRAIDKTNADILGEKTDVAQQYLDDYRNGKKAPWDEKFKRSGDDDLNREFGQPKKKPAASVPTRTAPPPSQSVVSGRDFMNQ